MPIGAGGSVSDPFKIADPRVVTNNQALVDFNSPGGRVLVDPRTLTGRVGIFAQAGQSNIGNSGNGGLYVPANASKVLNLNILSGGLYQALDPMLGCGGPYSAMGTKMGDKLITDGELDFVIIANCSVGATWIDLWKQGGGLNHRIGVMFKRIAMLTSMLNVVPSFKLFQWMQGESDNGLGTSQPVYSAGLTSVLATATAESGGWPAMVSKTTWTTVGVSVPIQNAQAASWNGVTVFEGPNTDTLDASYRWSGPDFSYAGMTTVSDLWCAKIAPLIV